jgi:hypothetical protein
MRQTEIGDISCWRYGLVESAKANFVGIEIRQFRPMWTRATRFDDAAWRDIFHYPKLCLQPRIILETNVCNAGPIIKIRNEIAGKTYRISVRGNVPTFKI